MKFRTRAGASGAIAGFRGLFRALKSGKSVFLAAELPPEPGRHIAPGIVALARKSGRPIIPVAAAGDKPLNFGSVGSYVVYAQSKHPDHAVEFVKFMASSEAQQYRAQLLKTGVTPDVVNQPVAQAAYEQVPQLKTAQEILGNSRIFPKNDHWSDVYAAIISGVEAIISGNDPKEALDGAANQANRGLRH